MVDVCALMSSQKQKANFSYGFAFDTYEDTDMDAPTLSHHNKHTRFVMMTMSV